MSILGTAIRAIRISVNTPVSKGNFGEMIVASIFDPRFFGNEEHYIINNIIIETDDGKSHQIDHVVIYKNGIFCLETKNISGHIQGDYDSLYWKANQHRFLNPIIQNRTHVKVLSALFDDVYDIHSIVVFVKDNKPTGVSPIVTNLSELKNYVKSFETNDPLTSEEMKCIYERLKNLRV